MNPSRIATTKGASNPTTHRVVRPVANGAAGTATAAIGRTYNM
jgi:hypothetical protein